MNSLPVNVELARVGDEVGYHLSFPPGSQSQDLHTAPGHGHGVFKLCRQSPIARDDGPAVCFGLN